MSNQDELTQKQRLLAIYVANKLKSDLRAQSMPAMDANIAPNTVIVKWYDIEYLFDVIHQHIQELSVQRENEEREVEKKKADLDNEIKEHQARSKSEAKRKAYQKAAATRAANKEKRIQASLDEQHTAIAAIEANNPKPKRGRPTKQSK